jgi:hypothetical protein
MKSTVKIFTYLFPRNVSNRSLPRSDRIYLFSPPFCTIAQMLNDTEGAFWSEWGALAEIAPDLALNVGDFGIGADSAIVLDYRHENPAVILGENQNPTYGYVALIILMSLQTCLGWKRVRACPDCRKEAFTSQGPRSGGHDDETRSGAARLVWCYEMKIDLRIRLVVVFLVLLVATIFWVGAFRFVSLPFLLAAWVFFLMYGRTTVRPTLITLMIWLPMTFSPIDVLPIPKGRRPRLVPLVMGLPTRETAERAQRGEVILGGCIVSGFEPKYYLVW